MVNKYPLWKNLLLVFILFFAVLYATPNLYGDDPSIEISGQDGAQVNTALLNQVGQVVNQAGIKYKSIQMQHKNALVRFTDTDTQLKARDLLKEALGDSYIVALNLAPATPAWLTAIGASPMKLGLDLRGGVHFLLDVDVNTVAMQRQEGSLRTISSALREANIRYVDLLQEKNQQQVFVQFRSSDDLAAAFSIIQRQFPELELTRKIGDGTYILIGSLSPTALTDIRQYAVEQTMTTLRNRVNELGISEALVQQQGPDRIAVDLPGVQDTARAKEILGGTATLEFRLVDQIHDPRNVVGGIMPAGVKLYRYNDQPILLKDPIILTGNSITNAAASFAEDGRPSVNIRLGGGGEGYFSRVTRDNIGKLMAVVYLETKIDNKTIDSKLVKVARKVERIISVATIQSALGTNFQITGLKDPEESRNLALLLRAGALPAPISIIEERLVGPSLGIENIRLGIQSIVVGFLIVVIFMAFYYGLFGVIADLALAFNLLLLVAILSLLGMTLTLPGMAGIVLTVGMAVDANVLIFERIREELRNGASPQASIYAGYDRALATIIDANLTTLIVAIILFGIGTGAVKGFAVTLTVGLLTSMLTGVMFSRALVNAIYGGRSIKKLSVGI